MRAIRSDVYTVTPRRGVITGLYVTATLFLLLIILQLAIRPLRDLYGPIVWWARYDGASAKQIVQELERDEIIPSGTTWQHADLFARRASLRLVLASPNDALAELAKHADLTIRYKVGYHGEIIAAPHIIAASRGRGIAIPEIDVKLERQLLSRPGAP